MDEFKGMSYDQLLAAVNEFMGTGKPQVPAPPLPAGLNPGTRTPEQLAQVSDNWVSFIMSKPHHTWTAEEQEAVRVACVRLTKEMGY